MIKVPKSVARANGAKGVSQGKAGGLGVALVGLVMALVAFVRAAGVELPVDDTSIRMVLEAALAFLAGLGIWGVRKRQDRQTG